MGGAACAKIIRNGFRSIQVITDIVEDAKKARAYGEYFENEEQIVKYLNEIENLAFKADRKCLEGQGFEGPWPYSLTQED